jgi:phosphomannomutase
MDPRRAAILAEVRAWLDKDTDPAAKAELAELVENERFDELEERFRAPLAFGTAGLRGLVGAGTARMNAVVVERVTRAVAEFLLSSEPDAKTLPVVVGYDARPTSRAFAQVAQRVLTEAKIPVRYFPRPCPTPLVAFAARELSATAGIVITASHNPAAYNGYKLYGRNAVQIVSPVDTEIERRAQRLEPRRIPENGPALRDGVPLAEPVADSLVERYLARIDGDRPRGAIDRSQSIVYTPLHGVGGELALRALSRAGFSNVTAVPEQAEPDGTFPTISSPNPEEPEALAMALSLAEKTKADLVLANDPDADRLAVCVPTAAGRYRALTGNQMGALLADFVLANPTVPSGKSLVVSTVVSSPLVAELSRARGARFEETLTGFKWIWTAALRLEAKENVTFAFGYEEAIGFSIGRAVRDKDGISAALWFAELSARARADGHSVLEKLAALYRRHGLWASAQRSVARGGPHGAEEIVSALDRTVRAPPFSLAGRRVCGVIDFRQGADQRPEWLPATPLVLVDLGKAGRVLLRPSGTEPKLKIYADLKREVGASDALWEAEAALAAEAAAAAAELSRHVGLE